jgi:hypothetical protein
LSDIFSTGNRIRTAVPQVTERDERYVESYPEADEAVSVANVRFRWDPRNIIQALAIIADAEN